MPRPGPNYPELIAMLLADARLPIGGHTRSACLEPALAAGEVDIPSFIDLQLRTLTRIDAASAVCTRHRVLCGGDLDEIMCHWQARTPSQALREDAALVGSALVRLASRLWKVPVLPESVPGPMVLGALAVGHGVSADALARIVAYDTVQTITSAALKLRPDDPAAAVGWTVGAFPAVEAAVTQAREITDPADIPASGAPTLDHFAETHRLTSRRLFRV